MSTHVYFLVGVQYDAALPPVAPAGNLYDDVAVARADLGVAIVLSRLAQGDAATDSLSWYLLSATLDCRSPGGGRAYYGYTVDDVVYPVAGGWDDGEDPGITHWRPFVAAYERSHAAACRFPWSESQLRRLDISGLDYGLGVDFSCFRFTPLRAELLVRPIDLFVTEPLF